MWCSHCQQEVPGAVRNAQVVCCFCGSLDQPQSATSVLDRFASLTTEDLGRRIDCTSDLHPSQPMSALFKSNTIALASVTPMAHATSIKSDSGTNPAATITRVEADHGMATVSERSNVDQTASHSKTVHARLKRIDEIRREIETETSSYVSAEPTHPQRIAGFFVVVFVFGQVMSTWALVSGHFAAWLCGLVFTTAGAGIAFFSVMSQLDYHQEKIKQLQNLVNIPSSTTDRLAQGPANRSLFQDRPVLAEKESA